MMMGCTNEEYGKEYGQKKAGDIGTKGTEEWKNTDEGNVLT